MSEEQDYFFAVLKNRMRDGDSPEVALSGAAFDTGEVFGWEAYEQEEAKVTTNPNPGPGYRLATEQDVGATVFDVSDTGEEWKSHQKYENPRLAYTGDENYPWLPERTACNWKYARVPCDKPAFVPGEWYAVGGEKLCYVGCNPVNGKHIFSKEDGAMYAVEKVNSISPWSDPPAFRLCTAKMRDGTQWPFVIAGSYCMRSDGYRAVIGDLHDIRWHDESEEKSRD